MLRHIENLVKILLHYNGSKWHILRPIKVSAFKQSFTLFDLGSARIDRLHKARGPNSISPSTIPQNNPLEIKDAIKRCQRLNTTLDL